MMQMDRHYKFENVVSIFRQRAKYLQDFTQRFVLCENFESNCAKREWDSTKNEVLQCLLCAKPPRYTIQVHMPSQGMQTPFLCLLVNET